MPFRDRLPAELVGVWRVTEGPLEGATLEIRSEGVAIAKLYKEGKIEVTRSSLTVEGKQMLLTIRDESSGKEDTVTQMIVTLTENELVIRDEDQNTYRMRRIR